MYEKIIVTLCTMKKIATAIAIIVLSSIQAFAQLDLSQVAKFDKTVHDFGAVTLDAGELKCKFTLTNISDEPLTILAVISSCGCTGVEWTRTAIAPGETGVIKATYNNDEGPYPFDKTLTVYVENVKKPVILHLRGEVKDPKRSKKK